MIASINLNPFNFLILSGVLQGILLGLLLLFINSSQSKSNRWLALTIICVNLHILYLMLIDLDLERRYPFLLWFPYSYLTAIGPLIYLYVKSLIAERFTIDFTEYKRFIPVGIEVGLQLFYIGYGIQHDEVYYNTPYNAGLSVVIFLAAAVSIFYYLKRSRNLLQNHQHWAKANFSTIDSVTPGWLYELLKYYRVTWLLWVPFVIIFLFIFRLQWQYFILILTAYALLLYITYLTYWIGIKGFSQMGLIKPFKNEPNSKPGSTYGKLNDSQVKQYLTQINELMQKEKLFLEQDLDLRGLAKHVEFEPNLLSYLLNHHLGKSFYEYVNSLRIEEVKQRLESDEFRHLSILAIAFDCGFNSKTSYNRIFKQMTGLTPSQYQKEHRKV